MSHFFQLEPWDSRICQIPLFFVSCQPPSLYCLESFDFLSSIEYTVFLKKGNAKGGGKKTVPGNTVLYIISLLLSK